MMFPHWQYFLVLEREFADTLQYVALTKDNLNTYSIRYAWIFLSTCSEIDVVFKVLCEQVEPGAKPKGTFWTINDSRDVLLKHFPKFPLMIVTIPQYRTTAKPWEEWGNGSHPSWWSSYNKVKHHRHEHFEKASLSNVIDALAGLYCLVLYLHRDIHGDQDNRSQALVPEPVLFDYDCAFIRMSGHKRPILPDFPLKG